MSSDTPLEHLDPEFDQELGLAPEPIMQTTQVTGGQKLALIIVVGFFTLLALLHILSLILVLFFGSGESSILLWAAKFSSIWAGIFGSGFVAYVLVLIVGAVGTMYKPELFHPRVLELTTKEKLMALVPLVPVGILYLVNKGLVLYLTGQL